MARLLVESDGEAEEGVDNIGIIVELLVDHQGQDAHLSGTAVVQLDGELLVDGVSIPAGSLQLSLLDLLLSSSESNFEQTDEHEELEDSSWGDIREGSKATANLGEGDGEVAREADTSGGDDVAENGKLGNSAVLGLDGAEAVEALLVSILQDAKGIPEAKRGLSTELTLEAHLEGSRASNACDWGESGSEADEGDEEEGSTEHCPRYFDFGNLIVHTRVHYGMN